MIDQHFPKHMRKMFGDQRNFKIYARSYLKQLSKAYSELQHGCAYFPVGGYTEMHTINASLKKLQQILSQRNWGR